MLGDVAALAQLGAAVTLLWLRMPAEFQAEALELMDRVVGVPTKADASLTIKRLVEINRMPSH